MSRIPDPEGGAGDRVNADVAVVRQRREGSERTRGTSIQGAGIDLETAMSMGSPEKSRGRTSTPQEEDRGDELGGSDSSLTNLRGGAGTDSPNDPSRPRMPYLHNNSQIQSPQNEYYSDPNLSGASNTFQPQHPHYGPLHSRTDARAQAQQTLYDYPLATYDPLNHPAYTESNASSSPTYHARLSSLPWDYHYNNQQHQQHSTPQQPPSRPLTNPDNQIPPHHLYPAPTTYIDQSIHTHTHMPPIPGPSQHHLHPLPQHRQQQPQYQHHTFPLARDPYPPHSGYAYSDPQHQASGSGSRYEYDHAGAGASGSAPAGHLGGGQGHGHGQRRTSLDGGQVGKKPITTSRLGLDPVAKQERRREQNRVAQRAFRARAKIREQERSDDFDDDNQNEDVFDAR